MVVIALLLSAVGVGFLCWLLFALAIYALPFCAGLAAGFAALHGGAGAIGAFLIGIVAGSATLFIGQLAFATVRTPLIRGLIGLLYAVPAAIMGHQLSLELAAIGVSSQGWREAIAVVGAVLAGCTAFSRMALLIQPPAGQRIAETRSSPALAGAPREG